MTEQDEVERLKARLAELEAGQGKQPAQLGGMFSMFQGVATLIQHVVALAPRPLLIAAGLVAVAWGGFEVLQTMQQAKIQTDTMLAQKAKAEAEAVKADAEAKAAAYNELTEMPSQKAAIERFKKEYPDDDKDNSSTSSPEEEAMIKAEVRRKAIERHKREAAQRGETN